jgi:DNA topoisomerase I
MPNAKPIFDPAKIREMIAKGRRAKWWERKGTPKSGFRYRDANGNQITKTDQLERIKALVVPPAWKYVRISPAKGGRQQAVGMDTTGRIQYIYHPKFSARQQRKKFSKIEKFGEFLPRLRKLTNEHIALEGFPREKVLAIVLRLTNSLYMRVGTEKSAKKYRTFGITTLQNRHLTIGRNGKLKFDFVGKSHISHRLVLVDHELAGLMKQLKDIGPKRKLFHYITEEGKPQAIKPSDINRYLKEATSTEFSAKDFRTWGGTLLAAVELAEIGKAGDEATIKKNIVSAVKRVADQLGNTPAVCRDSYIHPKVLAAYESGITIDEFRPRRSRSIKRIQAEYEPEEKALLKLFENGSK